MIIVSSWHLRHFNDFYSSPYIVLMWIYIFSVSLIWDAINNMRGASINYLMLARWVNQKSIDLAVFKSPYGLAALKTKKLDNFSGNCKEFVGITASILLRYLG